MTAGPLFSTMTLQTSPLVPSSIVRFQNQKGKRRRRRRDARTKGRAKDLFPRRSVQQPKQGRQGRQSSLLLLREWCSNRLAMVGVSKPAHLTTVLQCSHSLWSPGNPCASSRRSDLSAIILSRCVFGHCGVDEHSGSLLPASYKAKTRPMNRRLPAPTSNSPNQKPTVDSRRSAKKYKALRAHPTTSSTTMTKKKATVTGTSLSARVQDALRNIGMAFDPTKNGSCYFTKHPDRGVSIDVRSRPFCRPIRGVPLHRVKTQRQTQPPSEHWQQEKDLGLWQDPNPLDEF
jgi:hypothetical protein